MTAAARPRDRAAARRGNRGNGRQDLFHKPADFDAFLRVLSKGLGRYPVGLLGYCLVTNHWHLLLRPGAAPAALAGLMGWVGVTLVRRHHEHYRTRGGEEQDWGHSECPLFLHPNLLTPVAARSCGLSERHSGHSHYSRLRDNVNVPNPVRHLNVILLLDT